MKRTFWAFLAFIITTVFVISCHSNDEKLQAPGKVVDTLSIQQEVGVYSILDTTYSVYSKILYGDKIVFSSFKVVKDDSLNYVKNDLKKKMEKAREIISYMESRGVNSELAGYLETWLDYEVDKDDSVKNKELIILEDKLNQWKSMGK